MNISKIQPTSFYGINLLPGGKEYVAKNEGASGVAALNTAMKEFGDTGWELNVSEQGYSLKSPTTKRTYTGPFSVRKKYKVDENNQMSTRIIVRMDEDNRVRFPILFSDKLDVIKIYRKFKGATGIKQLLILLSVLEKRALK